MSMGDAGDGIYGEWDRQRKLQQAIDKRDRVITELRHEVKRLKDKLSELEGQ